MPTSYSCMTSTSRFLYELGIGNSCQFFWGTPYAVCCGEFAKMSRNHAAKNSMIHCDPSQPEKVPELFQLRRDKSLLVLRQLRMRKNQSRR